MAHHMEHQETHGQAPEPQARLALFRHGLAMILGECFQAFVELLIESPVANQHIGFQV